MMQSELILPSWPNSNFPCSSLNPNTPYDQEMDFVGLDFSCSVISSNTASYFPTVFDDEFLDLESLSDEIQIYDEWINGNENYSSPQSMEEEIWSPCVSLESSQNSVILPLPNTPLIILPGANMEVDGQLSLIHLLRAYGEAMENGEKELADVIVKSINGKSSPSGNTMERVAYNLFRSKENEGEYLRRESSKNIVPAFKVLYQSLPNGRFAHFGANSAVLESMPNDVKTLLIVDFDMGDGVQWPPLIEGLSGKDKALRIISIKSEQECTSSCWEFEETKKRLLYHARQYGVDLKIEEKGIDKLGSEVMKRREWVVFNCMVGLPHMGRRRSRKSVNDFLKVAKEFLVNFDGIVTFGDGEVCESSNNIYCGYSSYFDGLLRHYQALFESLERNFPVYLGEARTAMESLFLAPFMCPVDWSRDWEDTTKGDVFREGRKMSQESLAEAKEMVNERENSYKVKIEMFREHEMVLQWKETPLVRVSTWRC